MTNVKWLRSPLRKSERGVTVNTDMTVTFDGGTAENGEFDVRHLAPALISLVDLVAASASQIDPEIKPPKIVVKQIKEGSYIVELSVDIAAAAATLIPVLSPLELATSIVNNTISAINYLSRGFRAIQAGDSDSENLNVLINGDGNTVTVNNYVYQLASSKENLQSVRNIVDPIRGDAAETVALSGTQTPEIKLTAHDLDLSEAAETPESKVNEYDWRLLIVEVPLANPENKWKLSDNTPMWYLIEDQEFLNKVKTRQVSFSVGDQLDARIRRIQTTFRGRTTTENFVTRVRDIIYSNEQQTQLQIE